MFEIHVCNRNGRLLKAYAVGEADEVIIGREAHCDVRIDARSVSREHCVLEREDDRLFLRDLGSTSGTFHQGRRIERIPLSDGLEVTIGPVSLRFVDA